ncbi:MAG TPA: bifunctional diaminohydroxyphosphoribosylaminopyrimidine deaminase/5-amino-6-(5-phosphoribosylamino)uracil reductase RibD [Verrucomicrobiae bacterium]|jgi:diaminohydroxyphosphoribosylaminopyrimidine deaminase/5-amino-6-(5-phosphoribosylamino)uracil reductase|nr:bifunctional diaminohydroxyphosphoribosylaminopyrimidine deaminase/5-amino-6-(5-phosphoribosylamino)uracil reductase RibD [Verrucomicrobiae bacterium]
MKPEGDGEHFMRQALALARRGYGRTSPNPMVGAVLVRNNVVMGEGWHHAAGCPHAEIEALEAVRRRGEKIEGATLYVTLEPCSTFGRTPPCSAAIIEAGIKRVVAAATDPNPAHQGQGFEILRRAGIEVTCGLMEAEARQLNEAFNHWIVHRTPFVTLKAGMTLDGKIATRTFASRWITGEKARRDSMRRRAGHDAILVGVNTILRDDPQLTVRERGFTNKILRRIVLDPRGRTPRGARVLQGAGALVVVTAAAPRRRVERLQEQARVLCAPTRGGQIDLQWLLATLGGENVVSLLVEGGGETHARFLRANLAQRALFYYAPLIIGGAAAPKAVGGRGILKLDEGLILREPAWARVGDDLRLTALIQAR